MTKVLYFALDSVLTEKEKIDVMSLEISHYIVVVMNARYVDGIKPEECDAVGGAIPELYKDKPNVFAKKVQETEEMIEFETPLDEDEKKTPKKPNKPKASNWKPNI